MRNGEKIWFNLNEMLSESIQRLKDPSKLGKKQKKRGKNHCMD